VCGAWADTLYPVYTVTTEGDGIATNLLEECTVQVVDAEGATPREVAYADLDKSAGNFHGTFVINAASYLMGSVTMTNFTGEIRIQSGALIVDAVGWLGVAVSSQAPKVYVADGASLVPTCPVVRGGKIYRDVYGGGSLASVGQATDSSTGLATVTIETGAVVGDDFCVANGFGGNVFGSGRGMVKLATGPDYSQMAYVNNTEVIIKGHAMGNVYGGGNAGHVRHNTHVQILDGALVGTTYEGNVYYGNVFGAGKGTSRSGDYSATAGAVLGSVVVDMLGGTVLNDVYGGAALANSNIGNATNYGTASEAISSTSTNTTTVNLVGGTINNAYGGGQGDDATAAIAYGDASVLLNGSTATGAANTCKVKGYIFGGNNINGTPKGHALVHI
jgi:hypothetical protein